MEYDDDVPIIGTGTAHSISNETIRKPKVIKINGFIRPKIHKGTPTGRGKAQGRKGARA